MKNNMTLPKWFDVTAPQSVLRANDVETLLEQLDCERYAFANETGEGGYKHWQIRYVLKKEASLESQIEVWSMYGSHVSPTRVRNFNYIMKTDNYVTSWEKELNEYRELQYRPWQKYTLKIIETQDDRKIFVIQDPHGRAGKTTFAKHLVANHKAIYIPPMEDAKDYIAMAMAKARDGRRETFIIDVPRAESMKKKAGMWSAIEQIKNGYLYDKRYSWSERWIKSPVIIVMTNECDIPKEKLSDDRWNIYTIAPWDR